MALFCPACGVQNPFERESCLDCGRRLPGLIRENPTSASYPIFGMEDPYVLQDRVHDLVEKFDRLDGDLDLLMSVAEYQERAWMVNRAGILSLFDFLGEHVGVTRDEMVAKWQLRTRDFLADIVFKERFLALKRSIVSDNEETSEDFLASLGEAEEALFSGDRERAMILLGRALDLDPDNGHILLLMGQACLDLLDIDHADVYLERAGEVLAKDRDVLKARGILALHKGKKKDARILLQKARQQGEESSTLFLALGYSSLLSGKLEDATAYLDMARQEEPSAPISLLMSLVQALAGEYRDAMSWAEEAVEIDPVYWDALAHFRFLARELGNTRKEKIVTSRMLLIAPDINPDKIKRKGVGLHPGHLNLAELLGEVNRSAHQVILKAMVESPSEG